VVNGLTILATVPSLCFRGAAAPDATMIDDLVYDVGMNNGDDTAYYLARGYRVVAIEADPTLIEDAKVRFAAEIKAGRLALVNSAVGPSNCTMPFWICPENRVWNTFDKAFMERSPLKFHSIDVPVRLFGEVMREHGVPMYLKIDIEGYDHYCLDAIDPADRPRFVSWEIGPLTDLFNVQRLGYNAFQCMSQATFQPLKLGPRRGHPPGSSQRENKERLKQTIAEIPGARQVVRGLRRLVRGAPAQGNAGDGHAGVPQRNLHDNAPIVRTINLPGGPWSFRFGSSGPFGPDLEQNWKTADEVAYDYMDMWLHGGRIGDARSDWFDVHATTMDEAHAPKPLWDKL
jgi:FkbM family methyltransferase